MEDSPRGKHGDGVGVTPCDFSGLAIKNSSQTVRVGFVFFAFL
jgi:hypothetical protein